MRTICCIIKLSSSLDGEKGRIREVWHFIGIIAIVLSAASLNGTSHTHTSTPSPAFRHNLWKLRNSGLCKCAGNPLDTTSLRLPPPPPTHHRNHLHWCTLCYHCVLSFLWGYYHFLIYPWYSGRVTNAMRFWVRICHKKGLNTVHIPHLQLCAFLLVLDPTFRKLQTVARLKNY